MSTSHEITGKTPWRRSPGEYTRNIPHGLIAFLLIAGFGAGIRYASYSPSESGSQAFSGHHRAEGENRPADASRHKTATRPTTTVNVVSCQPLPNVPGKSITTAVVKFPPRAYTPAHRHPGSVTAYVLHGVVRSQMDGVPAGDFGAGETWFEPPGALHLFAENTSATEPASLLAIFVTDEGCGPLTILAD